MEDAYRGSAAPVVKEEKGEKKALASKVSIIAPIHCQGLTLSDLEAMVEEAHFENMNFEVGETRTVRTDGIYEVVQKS